MNFPSLFLLAPIADVVAEHWEPLIVLIAKLATDSKPITDDLAKLRADYEQLAKDVRAQRDGSGTTTTTA